MYIIKSHDLVFYPKGSLFFLYYIKHYPHCIEYQEKKDRLIEKIDDVWHTSTHINRIAEDVERTKSFTLCHYQTRKPSICKKTTKNYQKRKKCCCCLFIVFLFFSLISKYCWWVGGKNDSSHSLSRLLMIWKERKEERMNKMHENKTFAVTTSYYYTHTHTFHPCSYNNNNRIDDDAKTNASKRKRMLSTFFLRFSSFRFLSFRSIAFFLSFFLHLTARKTW